VPGRSQSIAYFRNSVFALQAVFGHVFQISRRSARASSVRTNRDRLTWRIPPGTVRSIAGPIRTRHPRRGTHRDKPVRLRAAVAPAVLRGRLPGSARPPRAAAAVREDLANSLVPTRHQSWVATSRPQQAPMGLRAPRQTETRSVAGLERVPPPAGRCGLSRPFSPSSTNSSSRESFVLASRTLICIRSGSST
jgi:hypothetical protein